jgi:transcriptional regulator GlxA family with amidase domain
MRNVAIIVFDDVEELDFVGPLEVFGVAERLHPGSFRTCVVAERRQSIRGVSGLVVEPEFALSQAPVPDVVIVPGGRGARREMTNSVLLNWVRKFAGRVEVTASVCTGALILASAGLLDGRRATTHWAARGELGAFPGVSLTDGRYVDEGTVVTAAGISAGIDMALHLVERFHGREMADEVAHRMEYEAAHPPSSSRGARRTPARPRAKGRTQPRPERRDAVRIEPVESLGRSTSSTATPSGSDT